MWETVYGKGQEETKSPPMCFIVCENVGTRVPWYICGGQRTALRNRVSSAAQVPRNQTPVVRLVWQAYIPTESPCEREYMYLKDSFGASIECSALSSILNDEYSQGTGQALAGKALFKMAFLWKNYVKS